MSTLIKKLSFCLCALLVAMTPISVSFAADDDPIAKAIKARRAGFQLYSFYAGQLFAMAKGEQDYDAELAGTLANNLNSVATLNNGMMWIPGSHKEERKGKTRAKKEIWQEGSTIGEKSAALKKATAELAEVAGSGLDALRGKIGALGESCKGCHDNYRHKEF